LAFGQDLVQLMQCEENGQRYFIHGSSIIAS
jgi:hypothetical protein